LDDEQIDAALFEPGRLEALEMRSRDAIRSLLGTLEPQSEDVARAVVGVAASAVRHVAPEFLQRVAIPAQDIARNVNHISPMAVFTADWSAHPDSGGVETLCLVAIPESMRTQVQQVRAAVGPGGSELEIITHQDEERVVMTMQHHGFPLYALSETRQCAGAFKTSDAMNRALRFVEPTPEVRDWSITPLDPGATRQFFALALAMNRIRHLGQRYVFNAGTSGSADIVLAEGQNPGEVRITARDEFLRSGYATQIQTLIKQRVHTEGNESLHDELGRWVSQQEERFVDPAYPDDLKEDVESVRKYQTSLRAY
jgi:hypothetical protein